MAWDISTSLRELRTAVDSFDRARVGALCAELIKRVRDDDTPCPERGASDILAQLRRKRHFTLLQQVADAFIQSGADHPRILRQYCQSLLDQGNLTASIAVLQQLIAGTTDQLIENAETQALLGRAYKQLYTIAGPGASARRRIYLDRAIDNYRDAFRKHGDLWHDINVSALLARASRDGLVPSSFPEPGKAAEDIAAHVLEQIEASRDDIRTWDRATAVEACVALGRTEDALCWLDSYLQAPETDAFELGTTLRQLTDVWQLNADADPGARLLPVLKATLLQRSGGQELFVGSGDIAPDALQRIDEPVGFEKIFGTDRFKNLTWFRLALERCRAVGRVEDPFEGGVGTGFLVKGSDLHKSFPDRVFITNAHVLSADVPNALNPDQAVVTFRAIEQPGAAPSTYRIVEVLWSSLPHALDATIASLDRYPAEASDCPIAAHRPRTDSDPPAQTFIIGHPSGTEQLMFSIRDNQMLDSDDTKVHYRTPTLGGSSGSPVFNAVWETIAIHHFSDTNMPRLNGQEGTYAANEGIWLDRIKKELETTLP